MARDDVCPDHSPWAISDRCGLRAKPQSEGWFEAEKAGGGRLRADARPLSLAVSKNVGDGTD